MGYLQVSFPFISGRGVTCGGHGHTPYHMERGAVEDLASRQVGSGPFGEVTKAVRGAHHRGLLGTALALEGIPQLTGSTQQARALGRQKLPS